MYKPSEILTTGQRRRARQVLSYQLGERIISMEDSAPFIIVTRIHLCIPDILQFIKQIAIRNDEDIFQVEH